MSTWAKEKSMEVERNKMDNFYQGNKLSLLSFWHLAQRAFLWCMFYNLGASQPSSDYHSTWEFWSENNISIADIKEGRKQRLFQLVELERSLSGPVQKLVLGKQWNHAWLTTFTSWAWKGRLLYLQEIPCAGGLCHSQGCYSILFLRWQSREEMKCQNCGWGKWVLKV